MKTLITNAKIFYQHHLMDGEMLFDEHEILNIAPTIERQEDWQVVDGQGLAVLPGLVDTHVHLRDPGYTTKETIATGTMAAAAGGYTTIFAMPNVKPFPSTADVMERYLKNIEEHANVRVFPFGTITNDEQGKVPTNYRALKELGIHWFSDDGVGIQSEEVMALAMKRAKEADVMFSCHTEDMAYRKQKASVHESEYATQNGWIGIPSACESEQLKRDLVMVISNGLKYHADHISAKESVQALHAAKAQGADCSGEVTAHHLLLEDKDVKGPMWKMNPPLRSHEDRMALIEGLENGDLDFIANDHAPHTMEEKTRPMELSPFGIVALETAFPLLYTEFVENQKRWSLNQLIGWMAEKPAKRFGLEKCGKLEIGYRPDFFIADLNADVTIDPDTFQSMGKNTPFAGWKSVVDIKQTWFEGKPVYTKQK